LTFLDGASLAMLKSAAAGAVAEADWGSEDSLGWQSLAESTVAGGA
jgi:hypothetical protein